MALDQSEVQSVRDEVNNYEKIPEYVIILQNEAKRFMNILQANLNLWFAEYIPILYKRQHGNAFGALNMGTVSYTGGDIITIDIDFDEDWAIRKTGSFELKDGNKGRRDEDAYLPILMNEGWTVKNGWRKGIEHLGIGYGTHFIEMSIEDFKSDNPHGITFHVDLNYKGYQLKFDM